MNYLDPNKIAELLYTSIRQSDDTKFLLDEFVPIIFNGFTIRISAGNNSYCSPKIILNKISYYDSLQVMISEEIKEEIANICPMLDVRFGKFPWSKYFSYDRRDKSVPSYMGSYIPLQDVIRLIHDVFKVSRLRLFF